MTYVPAANRYDGMPYRRCGRSGPFLLIVYHTPAAWSFVNRFLQIYTKISYKYE